MMSSPISVHGKIYGKGIDVEHIAYEVTTQIWGQEQ